MRVKLIIPVWELIWLWLQPSQWDYQMRHSSAKRLASLTAFSRGPGSLIVYLWKLIASQIGCCTWVKENCNPVTENMTSPAVMMKYWGKSHIMWIELYGVTSIGITSCWVFQYSIILLSRGFQILKKWILLRRLHFRLTTDSASAGRQWCNSLLVER